MKTKHSTTTLALVLLIIMIASACGGDSPTPCEEVVTFPDANLEKAIRDELDKPKGDICQADLDGLTRFSADDKGIIDLTGIERLTSATKLTFIKNNICITRPTIISDFLHSRIVLQNSIRKIKSIGSTGALVIIYPVVQRHFCGPIVS